MQRFFAFLVTLFLGSVYILSPIDIIPELIAGPLGLVDDMGVLALIGKSFYDLMKSEEWNTPAAQYACAATFIAALIVPAAFCYFTLTLLT